MSTESGSSRGPGPAVAVDTDKMLQIMDAKIAVTANERHRRHLETVREHMYHEKMLNSDGVLGTLSAKSSYKLWVDGVDLGPKGIDDIRRWYVDTNIRGHRTFVIEYDLERIVVDDDVVVTEGQMNVVVDAAYVSGVLGLKCDPSAIMVAFVSADRVLATGCGLEVARRGVLHQRDAEPEFTTEARGRRDPRRVARVGGVVEDDLMIVASHRPAGHAS
jgi:hypothetical protein